MIVERTCFTEFLLPEEYFAIDFALELIRLRDVVNIALSDHVDVSYAAEVDELYLLYKVERRLLFRLLLEADYT